MNEENEKNPLCPICLETLTTKLYFTSVNHLCHKNCFDKLNFKSPISREGFSYYFPVKKVVKGKVYFEKRFKNSFKTIIYDLDGFNQDGFNRKGFDRDGFNVNGIDENGFNRNKELACEEKFKQAIRENPWNVYYVSGVFRNKYEIMKKRVKSDPITYQNGTLHLEKRNVDLAIIFIERDRSFSLISKHLHSNKKVGMVAVKSNPNSYQYVGKSLKVDDEIFKLTFQQS